MHSFPKDWDTLPWHLSEVAGLSIQNAWTVTRGCPDVTIAFVDRGFDLAHPRWEGRVSPFARGGGWGDRFHGTACTGLALADGGDGIWGVAPRCTFLPVLFDPEIDSQPLLEKRLEQVAEVCDVLAFCWSPFPGEHPLRPSLSRLLHSLATVGGPKRRGVVLVASAGNHASPVQTSQPVSWRHPRAGLLQTRGPVVNGYATHPEILCVGACNRAGSVSAYSNWGASVVLHAPSDDYDPLQPDRKRSEGLPTTAPGLGNGNGARLRNFGGTSAAAALAAGVAGLMRSAAPDCTARQIRQILIDSAQPLTPTGGARRLQATSAVQTLQNLSKECA
ncbi:MAG: S8 family serine peptidase [Vulcanimicrobiota bacterium]